MGSNGPSQNLLERAQKIREDSILSLGEIEKTENNAIIQESIKDIRNRVNSLDLTTLDDDKLSKLMTLSQLIEESKEVK